MLQTPFTFYRGAALNMAADLSMTALTGLSVQACGDCHLLNFGAFATPERRVILDINDFDETLPGPWEWDLKRLATSFVLASRSNGFSAASAREAALACVESYRKRMAEFSEMSALDTWYASLDIDRLMNIVRDKEAKVRLNKRLAKAKAQTALEHQFPELARVSGKKPTIKDAPPLIYHSRTLKLDNVEVAMAGYRDSLPESRRVLLDRYQLIDVALKVVGVGSVGTRCFVMLLMASEKDPLFLQIKEARPSVLQPYSGNQRNHLNDGQRIVYGSQLMQSASDLFLGWTRSKGGRDYYVRQLKDMKLKPQVEVFTPAVMQEYAEICGWVLARAHARSGEPAKLSGYLGNSEKFDEAIADFSERYADQSERDHGVLVKAVRAGKLEVVTQP
jgi:uncharacterized protein (DUF2252 family)